MKNGKCPKCNSREIYKKSSISSRTNLTISMFKQARLQDYVCTQCGFSETYVMKEDDLKKIKQKWERVEY